MSDPRYGYPYVPVYYPNKAPPPYASHPPGDQRLHTHPANVSGSSSSTSKLQKQRARPQMDEDPLPRHFLPPAVNGDKSKSVREIRHRHEMLQATYDKLTSNERISDETNQSMHHALRVHAAPAAPGTYRFLPPTNLSWGTSIDPNPAYAYSSCATLPVNMDSLPENFQPYADSPTKKESSRLKVGPLVLYVLHLLNLLVAQSGSLVIVRTSKMGRWKVGTYLSDDWYRESDVSFVSLSQLAPLTYFRGLTATTIKSATSTGILNRTAIYPRIFRASRLTTHLKSHLTTRNRL